MKDWIKKRLEMTPLRRLHITYWVATFQSVTMMSLLQSLAAEEPTVLHWSFYLAFWFILGIWYIRNYLAFDKETLWMTIKNPAKVTREEGDRSGMRPMSPPPPGLAHKPKAPPKPPPRRFGGGSSF